MLLSTLLLGISSISFSAAVNPLAIKGSKFFDSKTGNQFYMKGIAYQRSPNDPLLDGKQCTMDAELMSSLGANTIRVYHVEDGNHDACMKAFDDNGIYIIIDLDTFSTQIEQDGPPHWNSSQLLSFTTVLDEFAGYDNLAGFFIGNEIITNSNGSWAAPYIKAATRDVKAHIKSKNFPRPIYVGYSAADISELRPNLANYLTCGDDDSVNIDFYGLNAYEWCGDSSFQTSGYDQLQKNATGYAKPIFFSETGCNTPKPRTFEDQLSILGSDMDDVWSGAIVYEWIEEANNYGLISYSGTVNTKTAAGGDPYVRAGTPVPVSPDFQALSKVWAQVTPTGVNSNKYTPSSTSNVCPALTSGQWNVDPSSALPTLGQTAIAVAKNAPEQSQSQTASAGASQTSKPNGVGRITINFGILAGFLAAVVML